MRFYTQEECEGWLSGLGRRRPDLVPDLHSKRLFYPPLPYQMFVLAEWIALQLTHHMPVLLWITEWGIWPSHENWHLYYKLRQTDHDHRLLHEAPGHLFVEHEAHDLVSFLQLAMLNGWGGYFLPHAGWVNAFFSHDGFVDFYAQRIPATLRT